MNSILREIERTIEAKLYYAALSLSLTLPEICSRMELRNIASGRSSELYSDWFDRYLGEQYLFLTGLDCYYLRCGVAHHGKLTHRKSNFGRITFTLPHSNVTIHSSIVNDALNLDLVTFCGDLISAVEKWLGDKANDKRVQQNINDLVTLRPNGLSPYIVGIPLIA